MTDQQSIFGLRFRSNEAIQPGAQELSEFIDSPKKEGGLGRRADDLAGYAEAVRALEDFEHDRRQGVGQYPYAEKMLYGVLSHSHCFTSTLKSAVELYRYHCHTLTSLDLRKPAAFIRSAEEEIGRLSPKRKDDAAKIERLRSMTDSRKKDLDRAKALWLSLARELSGIAAYVRDNLVSVHRLCEASITVLVGLQVGRKEEARIIEDIKAHFRDQVRDSLQQGPVTKEYLDGLKEMVARLSKQMSLLLLEDIYSLTGLYEAMHGHAKSYAGKLDGLIAEAERKQHQNIDTDKDIYARTEETLLALLSGCRFSVRPRDIELPDGQQEGILLEKRKEVLDRLFELLRKGPR